MATVSLEEALRLAIAHHQAGRLSEAEAIYLQLLQQQPRHARAAHLMGVLAGQVGQLDARAATDWLERGFWKWIPRWSTPAAIWAMFISARETCPRPSLPIAALFNSPPTAPTFTAISCTRSIFIPPWTPRRSLPSTNAGKPCTP